MRTLPPLLILAALVAMAGAAKAASCEPLDTATIPAGTGVAVTLGDGPEDIPRWTVVLDTDGAWTLYGTRQGQVCIIDHGRDLMFNKGLRQIGEPS